MALLNFDASTVQPDEGAVAPVPAGWYNLAADESDIKPTKAGDGAFLAMRFKILDGAYAGRKVFQNFNIRNANPVAQEIAYKQLSALAHAVGVIQVADSQQLHGIPFKGKVTVETQEGREPTNVLKAYRNVNEQTDGVVVGVAAPSVPVAPAGFGPAPTAPAAPAFVQPAPAFVQPAPAAPAAPAFTAPPAAPPAQPWAQPAQVEAAPVAAAPAVPATPPWMKQS